MEQAVRHGRRVEKGDILHWWDRGQYEDSLKRTEDEASSMPTVTSLYADFQL